MTSLDPTAPAPDEMSRQADVEQTSPEGAAVEQPVPAPEPPQRTPPENLPAPE